MTVLRALDIGCTLFMGVLYHLCYPLLALASSPARVATCSSLHRECIEAMIRSSGPSSELQAALGLD